MTVKYNNQILILTKFIFKFHIDFFMSTHDYTIMISKEKEGG